MDEVNKAGKSRGRVSHLTYEFFMGQVYDIGIINIIQQKIFSKKFKDMLGLLKGVKAKKVENDKYMKDWNNKDIPYTKSKGGVIVVANPLDNLVYPNCIPWPTPEIVQKLYRSRQIRAFDGYQFSI